MSTNGSANGTANGFDYVRRTYGVPVKRGAVVEFNGQLGVITASAGHYVRARLVGDSRSRHFHPIDLVWRAPASEREPETHNQSPPRP